MQIISSIIRAFTSVGPQAVPVNLSAIRTSLGEWSTIPDVTTTVSEMEPAVRKAYETAYQAAISRHAVRGVLSATKAAVQATATPYSCSTTTTVGEVGQTVVRSFIYRLYLYTLVGFLLWCLFGPVRQRHWAFELREQCEEIAPQLPDMIRDLIHELVALAFLAIGAIVRLLLRVLLQNPLSVRARDGVREDFLRVRDAADQLLFRLRFNQVSDSAYLRYQEITHLIGSYKKHVMIGLVIFWFLSPIINSQKQQPTEVFVEWAELQRYWHEPLPEVLFWQHKEEGSNSHYHREQEMAVTADWFVDGGEETGREEPVVVVVGESISTTEIAESVAYESTVGAYVPEMAEKAQKARVAFCPHCQQWHGI